MFSLLQSVPKKYIVIPCKVAQLEECAARCPQPRIISDHWQHDACRLRPFQVQPAFSTLWASELGTGTQAEDGEFPRPWTDPREQHCEPQPQGRETSVPHKHQGLSVGLSKRHFSEDMMLPRHLAGSLGSSPLG